MNLVAADLLHLVALNLKRTSLLLLLLLLHLHYHNSCFTFRCTNEVSQCRTSQAAVFKTTTIMLNL